MNSHTNKLPLIALLAVLLSATLSCQTEETGLNGLEHGRTLWKTFTAAQNGLQPSDSKVSLNADKSVDWAASDTILYYSAAAGSVGSYVVSKAEHSTTFEAEVGESDRFLVAVYGGNSLTAHTAGGFTLSGAIKPEQTGRFRDAFVSVAKLADMSASELPFNCVNSVVEFSLERTDIAYVDFRAAGNAAIHGEGKLNVSFEGTQATASFGSITGSCIRVNTNGAGTFYMATLAGQLDSFTVVCHQADGTCAGIVKGTKALMLKTNGIVALGALDARIQPVELEHEAIDLGLPSGLKWASCNVGAYSPEEYGDYFAPGETTTKGYYEWSTYKWFSGNILTKYNTSNSYGTVDNKTVLDLEDDAAFVNWGPDWRMPTSEEFQELYDNCTWTWTTQNGVNGYKVTSNTNGNSLFLPAAGYRYGSSLDYAGVYGCYWSASVKSSYPLQELGLNFDSGVVLPSDGSTRHDGRSVRPVTTVSSGQIAVTGLSLSRSDLEMSVGVTDTIFAIVTPLNATDSSVVWTSSDPTVATVENGSVTALSLGSCTITATVGSFSATCLVRVLVGGVCSASIQDNVLWTYDKTQKVLTLSGTGAMADYSTTDDLPWAEYLSEIETFTAGEGLTVLGQNTCRDACNLSSVSLPSTLKELHAYAFCYCSQVTSVSLPQGLEFIGYMALGYCGITAITIPSSVTNMDTWFSQCFALETVTFENSAENLAWYMFESCKNLTSVSLPAGIQTIDQYAFLGCTGLSSLTLPSTLTEIQIGAFKGCINLLTLTCQATTPPTANSQAFADCPFLDSLTLFVPYEALEAYQTASVWKDLGIILAYDAPSHAYVDLGLPSGLKWATCNVGASSPEEYGDYFAWGETTAKSSYSWSTYKWCNGDYDTQTKYNTDSSYGTVDNKTVLDLEDDAARANWGGNWRMPTDEEFVELYNNCTWTWTTQNGVNGYKVTSNNNGNSLFLPAAGYRNGSSLGYAGSYGNYWSASLNSSFPLSARELYLDFGYVYPSLGNGYYVRCYGHSVRPVTE